MTSLDISERLAAEIKAFAAQENLDMDEMLETWLARATRPPHLDDPLYGNTLRRLIESAPVGVLLVNAAGEIVLVSENCLKMFGYTLPEIIHQDLEMLLPEAFRQRHVGLRKGYFKDLRSRGMGMGMELQAQRKDGSLFPIEVGLSYISLEEETIAMAFISDISERRRTGEVLRQSATLFQSLIESLPQNVFSKDVEGRFIFANNAYLKSEDKAIEDILGKTDYDLYPRELAEKYRADDRYVIENRQIFETVEEYFPLRGNKSYVHVLKAPLFDEYGNVRGVMGIFWDVTEHQKAQEHAMQIAVEKERVQMLSDFLRDVSHEFRTPLSVIYMNSALLGDTDLDHSQSQLLSRMTEQSHQLSRLVEALVQMSRLDGVTNFSFMPLDLRELLQLALTTVELEAKQKGVRLNFSPKKKLPSILADMDLLAQAFQNILDNAVRYTPKGGQINIDLRHEGGFLIVDIEDSGSGIAPDKLPLIFNQFYRSDDVHQTPGMGLGLTIADKVVRGHGGVIEAYSEVNRGSLFRVFLPASAE